LYGPKSKKVSVILSPLEPAYTRGFNMLNDKNKYFSGLILFSLIMIMVQLIESDQVYKGNTNYKKDVFQLAELESDPNDSHSSRQWALTDEHGVNASLAWSLIDAELINEADRPVIVVIDTGTFTDHEDIIDNLWRNPIELDNGFDDDGNGYIDDIHGINSYVGRLPSDGASQYVIDSFNTRMETSGITENGDPRPYNLASIKASGDHGTHTAGTINAQGNNGKGGVGINPHALLLTCNSSSGGAAISGAGVNNCIDYVIEQKNNGVNIIAVNMSFGIYTDNIYTIQSYKTILQRLLNENILVIAAAGNSRSAGQWDRFVGTNNDNSEDRAPHFPSSIEDYPNLISVSGHNELGALEKDSVNFGRATVDLTAPIAFFAPRVKVNADDSLNMVYYQKKSGSSKAAPIVAGAASLVYEYMLTQGRIDRSSYNFDDMLTIRSLLLACGNSVVGEDTLTSSGRKLKLASTDGTGAITCIDQVIANRLRPSQQEFVNIMDGESIKFSYKYIHCDGLYCDSEMDSINLVVKDSTGHKIILVELKDDGIATDSFAGDGIFSAEYNKNEHAAYVEFPNGDCLTIGNFDPANCLINSDELVTPIESVKLSFNTKNNVSAGTLVTAVANVTGGSDLEAMFKIKGPYTNNVWTELQAWGEIRKCNDMPCYELDTSNYLGKNMIRVWVRNKGEEEVVVNKRGLWVNN
jgi:hypothetical protein